MPKQQQHLYRVQVGQGWKYRLNEVIRQAGGRVTRDWQYSDSSSTEVFVHALFPGTAGDFQRAIWEGEMSSCYVSVDPIATRR